MSISNVFCLAFDFLADRVTYFMHIYKACRMPSSFILRIAMGWMYYPVEWRFISFFSGYASKSSGAFVWMLLITRGKKYVMFFAIMESQRVCTQSKPFLFFSFKLDLYVNSSGAKFSYWHQVGWPTTRVRLLNHIGNPEPREEVVAVGVQPLLCCGLVHLLILQGMFVYKVMKEMSVGRVLCKSVWGCEREWGMAQQGRYKRIVSVKHG